MGEEDSTESVDPTPERAGVLSVRLTPNQIEQLEELSEERDIPRATLIRKAVDVYLKLQDSPPTIERVDNLERRVDKLERIIDAIRDPDSVDHIGADELRDPDGLRDI